MPWRGVWDGRERDRQATEIPRNTDRARREEMGLGGGGDGDCGSGVCKEARCLHSVQGKDALARATAQQGRPDTRLEPWLQGWPWSSMSLYLIQSLLGREGTG